MEKHNTFKIALWVPNPSTYCRKNNSSVYLNEDKHDTESSDKRKAFLAVPENGTAGICSGCEISFTKLTILDNIKS